MSKTVFSPQLETVSGEVNQPSKAFADNERLVRALESCVRTLNEIGVSTFEALLKEPAPASDKETVFWNAYKPVADEYDNEFKEKYSTDLDTYLIFAGLFSAVSSAFIIQIQPELQPNSTATNQALLRLLIHTIDSSIFSGPEILIPEPTGPSIITVTVESFLYVSLFSTLLASLLVVLGKQWLLYYGAAGERARGTIAQRCLERQRKMDGVRKWKLEAVLNMYPLLLQLSLLLFTAALSIHLWQTRHSIAAFVLALAAVGLILYTALLVSPLISPDSPFRTPRTDMWIAVLSAIKRPLATIAFSVLDHYSRLSRLLRHRWSKCHRFLQFRSNNLPMFWTKQRMHVPKTPEAADVFIWQFPSSSPVVPALLWVLETSTDPEVVASAADMAVDLQWPLGLDLQGPLARLQQTFMECFSIHLEDRSMLLRPGLLDRAIRCGLAWGTVNLYVSDPNPGFFLRPFTFAIPDRVENHAQVNELRAVFNALRGSLDCVRGVQTPSVIAWVLRIIPYTLNQSAVRSDFNLSRFIEDLDSAKISLLTSSNYVDYLLCIASFLGFQPSPRVVGLANKSRDHCDFLTVKLFELLNSRMIADGIELALVERIVNITVRLADGVETDRTLGPGAFCRVREIYSFCRNASALEGCVSLALSALSLARIPRDYLIFGLQSKYSSINTTPDDLPWIYDMLEHLQPPKDQHEWDAKTCSTIGDLLQALLCIQPLETPTEVALCVIIQSLSTNAVSLLAFHILHRIITETESFLHDQTSWRIMQEEEFWPLAGQLARNNPDRLGSAYLEMGYMLSGISDWKPVISQNLASWIDTFYKMRSELQPQDGRERFDMVLCRVWAADSTGLHSEDAIVQSMVFVLTSLTHVWTGFDFRELGSGTSLWLLVKSTASTVIRSDYCTPGNSVRHNGATQAFQHVLDDLYVRLAKAIGEASNHARSLITEQTSPDVLRERSNILEGAATALTQIMHRIEDRQTNGVRERAGSGYWKQTTEDMWRHIDRLEQSLETIELDAQ